MQRFVEDLNQLYCLKSHLTERIIDLGGHLSFSRSKYAIQSLVDQTDLELENLDLVFKLLNRQPSFTNCHEIIKSLENIYDDLTDAIEYPQLAHTLFLEYLNQIKTAEKGCLITLCRYSMGIDNPELKQLLLNELNMPECSLLDTFKNHYPESFKYKAKNVVS